MKGCRLHRWVVSRRLDDGGTLPSWVRRHLDGCADCRAHYERERRCADLLAAQAPAARIPAPPYLRQRVLANLESWEGGEESFPRTKWWTLGASVAAVVVAFFLLVGPRPHFGSSPHHAPLPPEAMAALDHWPNGTVVLDLGAQLDEPLESEWDSVMLDARDALAALSRSFTPREFTETR